MPSKKKKKVVWSFCWGRKANDRMRCCKKNVLDVLWLETSAFACFFKYNASRKKHWHTLQEVAMKPQIRNRWVHFASCYLCQRREALLLILPSTFHQGLRISSLLALHHLGKKAGAVPGGGRRGKGCSGGVDGYSSASGVRVGCPVCAAAAFKSFPTSQQ